MNERAATFRTGGGEIVGTTWGGTLCWYPRKPSSLACVSRDGDREHVIRCGWCPGCLELDRRRLADQLVEWAKKQVGKIWVAIIQCPLSKQSSVMARTRRTASFASSTGFYRISPQTCALLIVGKRPNTYSSGSSKSIAYELHAIKTTRGRRAWGLLTSGLLVSRDEWGAETNRFYHRGLPKLDGERWQVKTSGGLRKRHAGAGQGVRAVRDDVFLFPPLAWLPPRLARRKGPIEKRTDEPERVGTALANLCSRLRILPNRSEDRPNATGEIPAPAALTAHAASRSVGRTFARADHSSWNETRYISSRHSDRAEIDAWLERMKRIAESKAKGQGGPDG